MARDDAATTPQLDWAERILTELDELAPAGTPPLAEVMLTALRGQTRGEVSDWLDKAKGWPAKRRREVAKAAAEAGGVRVPSGRVQVEGVVVKIDEDVNQHDGRGGTVYRLTVRTDHGYALRGSLPSALKPGQYNCIEWQEWMDGLPGRRVRFTAQVEPSTRDVTFGFYKRPTKAVYV